MREIIAKQKTIAIIGGGPAGLMAAETLIGCGAEITVYDAKPSVGRKFLRAGVGGLNLTHSEPFDSFLTRYTARTPQLAPMLTAFGPDDVRTWAQALGFESFIGSSGRVFPVGMKASPLLRAWLKRLKVAGVQFRTGWRWKGFFTAENTESAEILRNTSSHDIWFDSPQGEKIISADAVILALGGGSWARLGSDAAWVPILAAQGVAIAPLRPANCGFNVAWSEHFKTKFDGAPLKTVVATAGAISQQGEFIVTREGVEGSLVYALSAPLRDELESTGSATLTLDLSPDWTQQRLYEALARPRGSRSVSSHLEKTVSIKGVKAGLLWEFIPREIFDNPQKLAAVIKALRIPLVSPHPMDEAISTAGGISFDALDAHLMLNALPGIFCAGEMLDWEAPTGGYLLTACLATGKWAAQGAKKYLEG